MFDKFDTLYTYSVIIQGDCCVYPNWASKMCFLLASCDVLFAVSVDVAAIIMSSTVALLLVLLMETV